MKEKSVSLLLDRVRDADEYIIQNNNLSMGHGKRLKELQKHIIGRNIFFKEDKCPPYIYM